VQLAATVDKIGDPQRVVANENRGFAALAAAQDLSLDRAQFGAGALIEHVCYAHAADIRSRGDESLEGIPKDFRKREARRGQALAGRRSNVRVVHRPAAQHYPRGDDAVVYEIGPFRLDPQLRTLTRTGAPEPIGPRAVAVLAALVAKAPEPVAKQSIMDAAWPGVVVEESNLSVQIAAIRRVLAAVAGGDRWIETISRRGYRFVGPVAMMRGGTLQEATSVSNVPRSLTSFVGRERELIDLKGLLAKNRLLSIIGPGGIGKTRLAVQLATEIPDAYRDGISFVDFAPLVDPALVASAAAQAIGVHDVQGGRLVATLCRQLEGRLMLLIFDNCEHVLDASAHLADALLRATARLTIIATSREPLRVPGEQIYRPPPLSLPNPAGDLDSIRRSDAVLLFVDRAQHQQHDFALTPERAPAVAELWRAT
jgi:DNA-binding winged helix-turn-helix (wHTH) protein